MRRLTLAALLGAFAISPSFGAVVINEFSFDDASTDDEEFIELYNSGPGAVDISGWTLEMVNGANGGVYGTITIPAATNLAASGFYLISFNATTASKLPAGVTTDTQSAIVPQNGSPDGFRLKNSSAVIQDAVGYGTNVVASLPADSKEGDGIYGLWAGTGIERTATIFDYSISRVVDGQDTNDNVRDFCKTAASPRSSNTAPQFETARPYSNNFNVTTGTSFGEFWGRFVDPTVDDPTVFASQKPGVSPGGGNAVLFSDTSGGGDTYHFNSRAHQNWVFEAYVYINSNPSTNTTVNGDVSWDVGFGCTDETFQHPGQTSTPTNYGSRGLFWRYANNQVAGTITLSLKERYSSAERTIGTPITISAGVNDGWQRLFLSRQGANVLGILGGTYGSTVGGTQRTDAAAEAIPGTFFVGFREFITDNNSWLWMDDISLTESAISAVSDWAIY